MKQMLAQGLDFLLQIVVLDVENLFIHSDGSVYERTLTTTYASSQGIPWKISLQKNLECWSIKHWIGALRVTRRETWASLWRSSYDFMVKVNYRDCKNSTHLPGCHQALWGSFPKAFWSCQSWNSDLQTALCRVQWASETCAHHTELQKVFGHGGCGRLSGKRLRWLVAL